MQIFPVSSVEDEVAFFQLSLSIYKNDANWIQPLDKDVREVFDPKKNDFTHYFHHDTFATASSLSNDNTIALLQDSRGLIWIATRDGLNYYDPATEKFSTLRKQNGLADNIILSIVEDKEHNIWAGTPNGLSNVIINKDAKSGKLLFQFRN